MPNLRNLFGQMSLYDPDAAELLGQVAALAPRAGGPGSIEELELALTNPHETFEFPLRKFRVPFDGKGELLPVGES